jgi:hypothetical protein
MTTGGEAVSGFVDAMKSQPLALALVVMNIALLAVFYFIVQSVEARHKIVSEERAQLVSLLAHCRSGAP